MPFLGCALTAYTDVTPVLDVTYFAEFLRGPDGTCAFCHGNPLADRPCECGGYMQAYKPTVGPILWDHIPHEDGCEKVTWIDPEFAASSSFETCPCCSGRPT